MPGRRLHPVRVGRGACNDEPVTSRADADRCPGVLRPHQAADGAVLRVRVPGGRITATALRALSEAAQRYGDGDLHLTSRANLQIRGVRTDEDGSVAPGLVDALAAAGLLPHPTHERVRNMLCSPLTGLVGGRADLRGLVDDLDRALCAAPDLVGLPGPFLFALDDGRGDLDVVRTDLAVIAVGPQQVRVWAGGRPGPLVPIADAPQTLVGLARQFLAAAAAPAGRPIWHVRELPERGAELVGDLEDPAPPVTAPAPLGVLTQHDAAATLSVLAPLGRLSGPQAAALARAASRGPGELVVTPWRGVLVPGQPAPAADPATLVATGLVADSSSPWRGVTACPGIRCAHGVGDTGAVARRVVEASSPGRSLPVHVVACGRACGRPTGRHLLVTVDRRRVEIRCGAGVLEESPARAPELVAAMRTEVGR